MENVLRKVRAQLLFRQLNNGQLVDNELILCQAIALQTYRNEYIWSQSEDEETEIQIIRKEIESGTFDANSILCYAMYYPLFHLENASSIAKIFKDKLPTILSNDAFQKLLFDYLYEQQLKETIPSFGSINDNTSVAVREQYEDSPYPRWMEIMKPRISIDTLLRNKNPNYVPSLDAKNVKVLIAGCGTGIQPIQLAVGNPSYDILAVDISKSSIAYAKRMADKLGVTNIEFLHGDILDLKLLNRQFHHVESTGVIHHMEDQDKAWEVLNSVLLPGGTLFISVYSKIARMSITQLRMIIQNKGIDSSLASMKLFRQELIDQSSFYANQLGTLTDFFTASMLRDLLFHISEYQYLVSEIENYLKQYHLNFMNFSFFPKIEKRYIRLYPDDPNMINFDNLKNFEKNLAGTFTMLNFVAQKQRV